MWRRGARAGKLRRLDWKVSRGAPSLNMSVIQSPQCDPQGFLMAVVLVLENGDTSLLDFTSFFIIKLVPLHCSGK